MNNWQPEWFPVYQRSTLFNRFLLTPLVQGLSFMADRNGLPPPLFSHSCVLLKTFDAEWKVKFGKAWKVEFVRSVWINTKRTLGGTTQLSLCVHAKPRPQGHVKLSCQVAKMYAENFGRGEELKHVAIPTRMRWVVSTPTPSSHKWAYEQGWACTITRKYA